MKRRIVRVECLPVSTPLVKPVIMPNTRITAIDSVVLKITADDGTVGIADSGDTSSWYRGELQESIIAMIANVIAPRVLLGEDPRAIEKLVGRMDLLVRDNNQAKATVDFALHDLKAKLYGVPLVVSGDLHASAIGRMTRSGQVDLSANPVIAVLSGTIGTSERGWPSGVRKIGPQPSLHVSIQEWVKPIEQHGFTIADFTADKVVLRMFKWDRKTQAPDDLDTLQPFHTAELPRPG